MKDYKETNVERYDNDKTRLSVSENIYSSINPTGFYGYIKYFVLLRNVFKRVHDKLNKDYEDLKYCDVGCGLGGWMRMACEFLGNKENVYGFEYSMVRCTECRKINSNFHVAWGDMVENFPEDFQKVKFDIITAAVVFMHIKERKNIIKALKNVYNAISDEGGYFLWCDALARTHFDESDEQFAGFSKIEMDEMCEQVGFRLIKSGNMFRRVELFGKSFSSYYDIKKATLANIFLMELLEKMPIGHYSNTWRLYYKDGET